MVTLKPSIIAALVARQHGQVILTLEELGDAELLTVETSVNERRELVIKVHRPQKHTQRKGQE